MKMLKGIYVKIRLLFKLKNKIKYANFINLRFFLSLLIIISNKVD